MGADSTGRQGVTISVHRRIESSNANRITASEQAGWLGKTGSANKSSAVTSIFLSALSGHLPCTYWLNQPSTHHRAQLRAHNDGPHRSDVRRSECFCVCVWMHCMCVWTRERARARVCVRERERETHTQRDKDKKQEREWDGQRDKMGKTKPKRNAYYTVARFCFSLTRLRKTLNYLVNCAEGTAHYVNKALVCVCVCT